MMKNLILLLSFILTATLASAQNYQLNKTISNLPTVVNYDRINTFKVVARPNCMDPMTKSLSARILNRNNQYSGRIRIVGKVTNWGLQDFQSRSGQQSILIIENPGRSHQRVVARKDFINLPSGQTINIGFDTNWSTSNEFPPEYALIITYDPDIYIDANPNNDDCNSNNNKKVLSGYDIHKIF